MKSSRLERIKQRAQLRQFGLDYVALPSSEDNWALNPEFDEEAQPPELPQSGDEVEDYADLGDRDLVTAFRDLQRRGR